MYCKIYTRKEIAQTINNLLFSNGIYLKFDYFREDEEDNEHPYEYFFEFEEVDDSDGEEYQVKLTDSEYENLQNDFQKQLQFLFGFLDASPINYVYTILDCYDRGDIHPKEYLKGKEYFVR